MSDTPKLKMFRIALRVAEVCDWVNKHDLAEQVVSILERTPGRTVEVFYRATEEIKPPPQEFDRFEGTSAAHRRWG